MQTKDLSLIRYGYVFYDFHNVISALFDLYINYYPVLRNVLHSAQNIMDQLSSHEKDEGVNN